MIDFFLTFGGFMIAAIFIAALMVTLCGVMKSAKDARDRAFRNSRAEARQIQNGGS